jgi:hypothetical protein
MSTNRRSLLKGALLFAPLSQLERAAAAQDPSDDCNCTLAADGSPLDTATSELRPVIERYVVDLRDINRVYSLPGSQTRHAELESFYSRQFRQLEAVHFDSLSPSGKIDYLLLRNHTEHERSQLAADARQDSEIAEVIPFQQTIFRLEEARRRMENVNGQKSAEALVALRTAAAAARTATPAAKPIVLDRAARRLTLLRKTLTSWYDFYALYDPQFNWWVDGEYKKAADALDALALSLHAASGVAEPLDSADGNSGRDRVAGGSTPSPAPQLGTEAELAGAGPVGNDALAASLRYAMVPYTPDELIALANKEFAWCDSEMLRASREMGFGNDWKKALEAVKNKYVEPGQMIYLVRDLSHEAIEFIEKHELVTIPPLVKADYWEEAMTPKMQLVNPFFTGGATIQVSSPASSMNTAEKLESLRGNNMFFARATVFHELIPGHHMQFYMMQRYRRYREPFRTPFWTEGMAFYWEMLLWDLGFTHTPEQRVGALFWRMHRCARIIFSLSFHLGKMSAKECVAFLIDRVGHEPANAEGEVRRSFNGSYEPIYQCAYMLGALQFRALHKELVESGKMTNRAFHDAMYREGNIPVEILRLALNGQKIGRDYRTSWKFYGSLA